nr:uncharacterized protein LOC113741115 [Coffea arabica]
MNEEDQEKTAFYTDRGSLWCPARLTDEVESQEVRLRRHLRKVLGVYGFPPGIEANPDKVKAIQYMSPPRNLREVQRLNGRLAALNRFLSQSAEKALPFFKVLKKSDQFAWTEECQSAFDQLKQYLHHLPTLASPRPEEKLYLYLFAANEAVSAVLIRDEGTQVPVYYVSRALRGPETRTLRWRNCAGVSPRSSAIEALLPRPSYLRPDRPAHSANIAGRRLGAQQIHVRSDSQLVVRQVLGEYEAKDETMRRYLSKIHQLTAYFTYFEIQRIPRSENKRADALSRLASTSFSDLNKTVLVEVLDEPGYVEEVACPIHSEDTWMTPFILFLSQGTLPEDRTEARKIQRKAARYALRDGELYKRSYLGPWLRCVTPETGRHVLHEIHEGLCGAHVGHRMLAKKTMLLGYFWPSLRQDSQDLVIISDNGRQFAENPFKTWCETLGIKQHFTSVGHPQANGQAENFNRTLLHGLKTRLHRVGSSWVDELPSVLWSYRTTPRSATQETPFSLTYGAEAVIPAEILTPSPRLAAYAAEVNDEERQLDLYLVEERRELASARIASYKNTLAHYYNARVRHRRF